MDNEYYKRYEPFFGSWHIKRFIGAGSYGKVFEIERRDFDMVFTGALKAITIPADKSEYEQVLEAGMDREGASTYFRDYVQELNREIALMSRLKGHSNIVSYEDHQIIPHEDGIGWDILIRMELLKPINDALRQNKSFTRAEVIRLGTDLCRALEVCSTTSSTGISSPPTFLFRTPAITSWAISAWPASPAPPPARPPGQAP